MKRINYGIYGFIVAITISGFFACRKQDDTYRQFLEGGEIVYVEKADSLRAYSGKNRVKLSWIIFSDPDVSRARIFWNDGADSTEVAIARTTGIDTIEVVLDDLAEGSYTFDVYTYDDAGNSSIQADVFAQAYGENYVASLLNRAIQQIGYNNGKLELAWYGADNQAIGTEVTYTDVSDIQRKADVLPGDSVAVLADYKPNSPFEYVTYYKPDSMSIDTFSTHASTVEVQMQHHEHIDLDKSLFSPLYLPGDAPIWVTSSSEGNDLSNLWSGIFLGRQASSRAWYRTADGTGMPQHFQFDLGVSAKLNSFKLLQRGAFDHEALVYANANPRRWEVWGSNEPAEDGSYDGWVKLADCESHKPSGTPVGQRTPEDIAYAQAGETFQIPADKPPVRYIRLRILETWGNTTAVFISEVWLNGSYWTIVQE
ncbi:DUF4998 domain-containing protein [Parapedobacter tibetensis]|uniref:DUF4998 domain-containing protein n=1 Tax=Parapedobacter tibetensis TaxID=2972951 RepID=UPI00214D5FD5|nr:DUF4998 domain-containing protein [Parapedobacter tibetensis]